MKIDVRNFVGGITDYIQTENAESFEELDNVLITKDRDLVSRFGSQLIDENNTRPITNHNRPLKIIPIGETVYTVYGKEIVYYDGSYGKITGINTDNVLSNADDDTRVSIAFWNEHTIITDSKYSKPVKLYTDENGNGVCVNLGLPKPADTVTFTPLADDGATYIYSFVYKRDYFVGTTGFVDVSAVLQKQVTNASSTENTISNIPVLANTSETNYDTANIKVEIYRTADNGSTSYKVGEVDNGVTSFVDNTTDANLTGITLYTEAGVADNEQPPNAKYCEVVDNVCYYANSIEYPYRIWQSQPSDPDSVPSTYFLDFDSEIIGLTSFQSNLIVFTTRQVWRVEGTIDLFGAGLQRKVQVAENETCLHADSIVKTDRGVFFAGLSSFKLTNGYEIKPIPDEDRDFYRRYQDFSFNNKDIQGAFDNIGQRIYWCGKKSNNDYSTFVFDLTFNAFTTMSGLAGSFDTVALAFDSKGVMYRGNIDGHIFVHDEKSFDDPIVDNMLLISNWQKYPVIYNIKHIDFSFNEPSLNKWVTKCTLIGDGRTSVDILIRSYDDSYDVASELTPISFKSGMVWEDNAWIWEDNSDIWELELRMVQTRRFKRGGLRAKTKQLEITNAEVVLRESSPDNDDTKVVVNTLNKVITLNNPTAMDFPVYVIGKFIEINGLSYKIIEAGVDAVKVEDPQNTLVSGLSDWLIRGIPHNQQLHLSSFSYDFTYLDDDGGAYKEGASAQP